MAIQNKPNFFIIGAPKCGTTSLAAWLAEHPQIYISPVKEPHFFNRDGMYLTNTLDEYEALFVDANENHLAIGEASTHYLYSRTAVPGILKYQPDAKFIVCIRNPIEMAPSLHAERVWNGIEVVKDFEKAWRLQEARRNGKLIPATARRDPERLQYGEYCKLGKQLERLYSIVPQDRVLVLVLDDMAQNPAQEYQRVLQFLGVNDSFQPEFKIYNPRKGVRWPFLSFLFRYASQMRRAFGFKKRLDLYNKIQFSINSAQPERYVLSAEMRAELASFFAPDIALLEQLLNRDFSKWLASVA
jgi:hypothetical protein